MSSRRTTRAITRDDLQRVTALASLDDAALADIAASAQGVVYPPGTEIVGYLDSSRDVYFIVSGTVRANTLAASGRQITYQLLNAGEMFGELSAIDGQPRSTSCYAETETFVARLDDRAFDRLIVRHPEMARIILLKLAGLSRWLTERLYEYHAYDVRGRVFSELLRMAAQSDADPPEVQLTDRDMASRVGTTRENVTRIYSKLRRDGVIERRANTVRILDLHALQTLLQECEFG